MATSLFDPIIFRDLALPNRILVSPMCQYSSCDGFASDWHLVNVGSRAVGGAAVVFMEATAVTADGRISPQDLGIWRDEHVEMLSRIARFIRSQGAAPGIQLAHAGRKGSTIRPWDGHGAVSPAKGGWTPVAPTDEPFAAEYPTPRPLAAAELPGIVEAFRSAARRALKAGFEVVEIHAAHGYLLHQFCSPLINRRSDAYGGSFDHRVRLCLDVVDAVREVWPDGQPVFIRFSCTDWVPGGWDIDECVQLARLVRARGVDLIDCSSGGAVPYAQIPMAPGYQVPFAERIRKEAGVPTAAVGLITTAEQAEEIVQRGQADCVLMAREFLRDPYWPLHAAPKLNRTITWPPQYVRAAPPGTPIRSLEGTKDAKLTK